MKLYIGVFSISGYAWATWRNRYKPFNPVLGETYESHRKERGFRYVAEQVRLEISSPRIILDSICTASNP